MHVSVFTLSSCGTSRESHRRNQTGFKLWIRSYDKQRDVSPWMCPNSRRRVPSVIQPCFVDKRSKGSTSGFASNHKRRPPQLMFRLLSTNSANATKNGGVSVSNRHLLRFRCNKKTRLTLFQQQSSLTYPVVCLVRGDITLGDICVCWRYDATS